jgi:MFS family permease
VRRAGFRILLGAGLLTAAGGALALLATPPGTSYTLVWPGLVLFGLGEGLVLAPTTAAAVGSVAPERAGMASAAVNMFRQVGNVLGTA